MTQSLDSTLDSIDQDSNVSSPHGESQQQVYVQTTVVKNTRLNLPQMRGSVQLFQHYLSKNPRQRRTKEETNERWEAYKVKIYQQYGRMITGKLSSEKALIKRYSNPISFLKYKLKRAHNLVVSELSQANQDYYHEIGGVDDMNIMLRNIDSIRQMSQNLSSNSKSSQPSRKRRRISVSAAVGVNNNHNAQVNAQNMGIQSGSIGTAPLNLGPMVQLSAQELAQIPPKLESEIPFLSLNHALMRLKDKLDVFEVEKLDKKKVEMHDITIVKMNAVAEAVEKQFLTQPQLIGSIPSVGNQESTAFFCWLDHHKDVILKDSFVKNQTDCFMTQLVSLKANTNEWHQFLDKWRLRRILYSDQFTVVWRGLKKDLNIPGDPVEDVSSIQVDDPEDEDDADLIMPPRDHDKAET